MWSGRKHYLPTVDVVADEWFRWVIILGDLIYEKNFVASRCAVGEEESGRYVQWILE
jgi:hypothetical protein